MKTSLHFQSPSSVQGPVKHVADEKHKDVNTFEPRCKPKKKFKRFLHRGKPYQHKSVPMVIYRKKYQTVTVKNVPSTSLGCSLRY